MFARTTVALALLTLSTTAAAQDVSMRTGTLSVSGSATVHVVPDEIILGVGIETFAPTLDAAHQTSAAEGTRLLAALRRMGVSESGIRTDVLSVEAKAKDNDPQRGTAGFVVRRAYSVTLPDVKRYEEAVTVALSNGANRIMGAEFNDKRLRAHRDEARRMAVKAAKEKATLLATELGMKVGSARTISEHSYGEPTWRSWWGWHSYGGMHSQMRQNVSISPGEGSSDQGSLPLGRLAVSATVQVTFDLVP